jgi:DNA-binding transcriptional regulator YdaS (Cro superfamily)
MEHPIDRASKVFGSQQALATALGITKAAVWQWKEEGRQVPIQHCSAIERETGGKVTRQELRPDDWHLIWPELAKGKPTAKQAA